MKNILYLILFIMPVLLEAQNRANVQDRLLLPKTTMAIYSQRSVKESGYKNRLWVQHLLIGYFVGQGL